MPLLLRLRDMSLNAIFFLSGNTVAEDISKTEALEFLVGKGINDINCQKRPRSDTVTWGGIFQGNENSAGLNRRRCECQCQRQ